jgi:hypothetical protein
LFLLHKFFKLNVQKLAHGAYLGVEDSGGRTLAGDAAKLSPEFRDCALPQFA